MASLALPIISGVGSLFGGLFGGGAAKKASRQYIEGLNKARTSLEGSQEKALVGYQPYLQAGAGATGTLADLVGTPGKGLLTPWTREFHAPTAEEAEATPGYKFQLEQGRNAIENSASARGGLLSGSTMADIGKFSQGLASSNYNDVFNRSLTEYGQAYNTFRNNQSDAYNRLFGLSNQGLGAASGAGNVISNIGGDIASLYGQQGAARAQGTMGAANAYGSIFSGIGNAAMNYGLLRQLSMSPSSGGGGALPPAGANPGDWWKSLG